MHLARHDGVIDPMPLLQTPFARLGRTLLALAAVLGIAWSAFALHARAATATREPVVISQHQQGQVLVPDGSPLRQTLVVQPVSMQTVQVPFVLPATVDADPAKLVRILPPLVGRVVGLDKQLGDSVRAGDVLFRLESADLAQAVSDAQKARATLTLTQRALDRQRDLAAAEISSTRDLEQAQSDLEQARSEAARAQARLAQLGVGSRGTADGRVLPVRSPIAGHVVDLNAANGAYWNDLTAPLMTVADLSTVFVTANVDEKEMGSVYVGQATRLAFDAYPGEMLDAKVRYVGELLDPDTRRIKVRMPVANRDGRLKPGMFATATFLSKPHPALLVPLTAVVQSGFNSRIFVEVAPWRFEPRVVKLGAASQGSVEVVSGLKGNERIVVKDGVLLDD